MLLWRTRIQRLLIPIQSCNLLADQSVPTRSYALLNRRHHPLLIISRKRSILHDQALLIELLVEFFDLWVLRVHHLVFLKHSRGKVLNPSDILLSV